jgi:protein-S-isoprenylcysteine O-methyltransferase Ste14
MSAAGERPTAIDTAAAPPRAGFRRLVHRIMWSAAWDVAMRAIGLAWTGFLVWSSLANLGAFIVSEHAAEMSTVVFATAVAARVAFLTFLSCLVLFYVFRLEPFAKAAGARARLVALGGTFLPTCIAFLPRYDDSSLLNLTSFAFIAAGNGLSVWALGHLNRSASIMAEARRLVTSGPYRLVQHPVYLFEEIAIVGVLLSYLWPPSIAVVALLLAAGHLWCQLRRMDNEDAVLAAAFPGHADYRKRTARLVPGLY